MTPKEKIETLEEAAEKYTDGNHLEFAYIQEIPAFKAGAKWQQERMYSEEEAGKLVYNIIGKYGKHYDIMFDGAKLNELFEEFKKK